MSDPYIDPDTGVLKNRAGLTKPQDLEVFERDCTMVRAASVPPLRQPSADAYRALHRHLFQDVYAWAGTDRSVDMGKANAPFCRAAFIDDQMRRRFDAIAKDDRIKAGGKDRAGFVAGVAEHIVEINAIHPFRDGNGRTMRAFIGQLAERAGYRFDEAKIDGKAWLAASAIGHARGDHEPMAKVIDSGLSERQLSKSERIEQWREQAKAKGKARDRGMGD